MKTGALDHLLHHPCHAMVRTSAFYIIPHHTCVTPSVLYLMVSFNQKRSGGESAVMQNEVAPLTKDLKMILSVLQKFSPAPGKKTLNRLE